MTHRSSSFSLARPAAMGLAAFALFLLVLSPGLVFDRAEAAPYPQGGTPTPGIVRPVGFAGGVFSCDGWTVTIPEGIVSDGGYIHCGGFNPNLAPAPPAGYSLRRHTINVNIYDHNNQWITFFGKPLNFCYTYGDSDLAAAGGDVRKFTVITAPIEGSWTVSLTTVDPNRRQACALVDHLTLFDLALLTGQPATSATRAGGSATPASGATASAGGFTSVTFRFGYRYTVQPGDNLFRIALRYRTTVIAIRAANNLGSNLIYVGQALIVPTNFAFSPSTAPAPPTPTSASRGATPTLPATRAPGRTATPAASQPRTHIVKAGENLFRIAIQYNLTVADLQAANGLTSTTIFVGQQLIIPPAR